MTTNNSINNASPNIAAHSVMISEGANNQVGVLLATGQTLIGVTGSDPIAATLTSVQWNDVAGTTQAAAANQGYIISNVGQTTVTLPSVAAEGSVVAVSGKGSAGWVLAANTGQVIHFGNLASSTAGSLTSTNQWDTVLVLCVTANTTWVVQSAVGNLTVS